MVDLTAEVNLAETDVVVDVGSGAATGVVVFVVVVVVGAFVVVVGAIVVVVVVTVFCGLFFLGFFVFLVATVVVVAAIVVVEAASVVVVVVVVVVLTVVGFVRVDSWVGFLDFIVICAENPLLCVSSSCPPASPSEVITISILLPVDWIIIPSILSSS